MLGNLKFIVSPESFVLLKKCRSLTLKLVVLLLRFRDTKYYYSKKSAAVRERASNGYFLIATSGGLNQQRTGVSEILFSYVS